MNNPLINNRYKLIKRVSHHESCSVLLVEDLFSPGRELILKLLANHSNKSGPTNAHIRREFSILSQLNHPRLSRVFDFGRIYSLEGFDSPDLIDALFFTREWVEGKSLSDLYQSYDSKKIIDVLYQVVLLLEYLHQNKIIYGDLKPENIIISEDDILTFIDFGLSSYEDVDQINGGSLPYLAPEIIKGQNADGRADIYALGIMSYQFFIGSLPIQSKKFSDYIDWHLNRRDADTLLTELIIKRSNLSSAQQYFINKLAAPDYRERFATISEVRYYIEREFSSSQRFSISNRIDDAPSLVDTETIDDIKSSFLAFNVIGYDVLPGTLREESLRLLRWRFQLDGFNVVEFFFEQNLSIYKQLVRKIALIYPLDDSIADDDDQSLFSRYEYLASCIERQDSNLDSIFFFYDVDRLLEDERQQLDFLIKRLSRYEHIKFLIISSSEIRDVDVKYLFKNRKLEKEDIKDILSSKITGKNQRIVDELYDLSGGRREYLFILFDALAQYNWPLSPDLSDFSFKANADRDYRKLWKGLNLSNQRFIAHLSVLPSSSFIEKDPYLSQDDISELKRHEWIEESNGLYRLNLMKRSAIGKEIDSSLQEEFHRFYAEQTKSRSQQFTHYLALKDGKRIEEFYPHLFDALEKSGSYREALNLFNLYLKAKSLAPIKLEHALRKSRLLRRCIEYPKALNILSDYCGQSFEALLEYLYILREQSAFKKALTLITTSTIAQAHLDHPLLVVEHLRLLNHNDRYEEIIIRSETYLKSYHPDANLDDLTKIATAEIYMHYGRALGFLARHKEADIQFEYALTLANDLVANKAIRLRAEISGHMAIDAWRRGVYCSVKTYYLEAITGFKAINHAERLATTYFNLAAFELHLSSYGKAIHYFKEAGKYFYALGRRDALNALDINLGKIYLEIGLLEESEHYLNKAAHELTDKGRPSASALTTLLRGELFCHKGDLIEGVHLIERATTLYLELDQVRDAIDGLLDYAEILLDRDGDISSIKAVIKQIDDLEYQEKIDDLDLRKALVVLWIKANEEQNLDLLDSFNTLKGNLKDEDTWIAYRYHLLGLALFSSSKRDYQFHQNALNDILNRITKDLSEKEKRGLLARYSFDYRKTDTFAREDESEKLYRLLEINRTINSNIDNEELLMRIMDAAIELTGAERGFLLLADTKKDLKLELCRGIEFEGKKGEYSRSIAQEVFLSGEALISTNAQDDSRFSHVDSIHQLKLKSVLAIPIHAQNEKIGVIYLESRFKSGRFSSADERLLTAFGDQVAIAINNAQLIELNRKRSEELGKAKEKIEELAEERRKLLVEREYELVEVRADLERASEKFDISRGRFGLVGKSEAMQNIYSIIERVAKPDISILIEGESGTGKEMIARAIHQQSPRRHHRLVALNCASIPATLLESELFGYVRGAFTGAKKNKRGLIEEADQGILFLDEVGDMPPQMQVGLLRVLQEGTFRPLGGENENKVDIRVIAATNKPLLEQVDRGIFREDLYFRLCVIKVELPPLRKRKDDIPLFIDHFQQRMKEKGGFNVRPIKKKAIRKLEGYSWPGNVRELEHAFLNATVMAEGKYIDADDFNLLALKSLEPLSYDQEFGAEREKEEILNALKDNDWNKSKAAESLGMPRRTFYRRLKKYQIV